MQTNSSMTGEKEFLVHSLAKIGIRLSFDEENRIAYLNDIRIRYLSRTAVIQTLTDLFLEMQYYFQTNSKVPLIIDVGSESGCSITFFKILYPNARIISFEPHPLAYQIIQENIAHNHFENVITINAAVDSEVRDTLLYGDADYIDGECNILGCSIVEAWGMQRPTNTAMPTKTVKLSDYINEPVDFLKLDVEGAEYRVFEDLVKNDKFKYVQQFIMEVHQWDGIGRSKIIKDLEDAGFGDLIINDKYISLACPTPNRRWIQEHDIKLSLVRASKPIDIDKVNSCSKEELLKKLLYANRANLYDKIDLLDGIINSVPAGIYWKNLNFVYTGHNQYTSTLFNQQFSIYDGTIIGKIDHDVFPKHLADGYRFNDLRVISQRQEVREEIKLNNESAFDTYQVSSKKPLYNKKGELLGLVGITLDTTDQHRIAELQRINREQQNKLVEQENTQTSIKHVAHDIRSPLTNLLLLIEESLPHFPDNKRLLIQKTIQEIGAFANSLIDPYLSKNSDREPVKSFLILSLLVKNWLEEVKYHYNNTKIKFILNTGEKVDESFILGNKMTLKRSFINLMNNAVEAVDQNQGVIKVGINLKDNKYLELKIEDNGVGMSEKTLKTILEQKQVVSSKRDGHGVGFNQIYDMLGQHEIIFDIISKENEGCKIMMEIPTFDVPSWVARVVALKPDDELVVIDRKHELFDNWEYRFKKANFNVKMRHFYNCQEALDYVYKTETARNNLVFFTDWSVYNDYFEGSGLIGFSHLCRINYLITNVDENFIVKNQKFSPVIIKDIAEYIPFEMAE